MLFFISVVQQYIPVCSLLCMVAGICGPIAVFCDRWEHSEQLLLNHRKHYIIDEEPVHDQAGVWYALLGNQKVRVHFFFTSQLTPLPMNMEWVLFLMGIESLDCFFQHEGALFHMYSRAWAHMHAYFGEDHMMSKDLWAAWCLWHLPVSSIEPQGLSQPSNTCHVGIKHVKRKWWSFKRGICGFWQWTAWQFACGGGHFQHLL